MYSRYMGGGGREGGDALWTLDPLSTLCSAINNVQTEMALFFSQITWDVALRLCFKCGNMRKDTRSYPR